MTIKCEKHNADIIRVLCVNLEGSISGAEQSLLLLVRFVPENTQISAACPAGAFTDRLRSLGVRTYRISTPPRKFNHFFAWFFYLALVNMQLTLIVFKTKPRIIHANSVKAVLAAILAKVFTGSKLIWHMRDLNCSRLPARICCCLSSKVIAVSKTVKVKLIGLGVKAELIEVVYNGIAADNIEIRRKDQSSPVTFANIGQFVPWKNQLLFIEAAERFLRDGQKTRFILIGDDIFGRDSKYKKELINRVMSSPFASHIKITGWQDDLAAWWTQIDCLVHTADTEPFGRVVIEAMAHCVPVIAAAGCGPAEIIADGKTGLLFTPNDIEELLKAMKAIFQNRELAHNIAINARQHIVSNFQATRTAERISKIYEELIAA
jgi:L-malate glycosyltransferase